MLWSTWALSRSFTIPMRLWPSRSSAPAGPAVLAWSSLPTGGILPSRSLLSVIDAPTAALYIGSGANFVVGPVLNPEVARLCNRRKIAYMPGCGSASEISQAEELGVEIVKVFPGAQVGGPGFVKAMLAPMPWTRIMPTGGVDASEESIRAWFGAGVACVGMGSKLITKDLVAASDFDAITKKVAQVLAWIRESRR